MIYNEFSPEDTIRKIIGRNKIKYSTLTSLIDNRIKKLKSFVINVDSIMIDLHKFLDSLQDKNNDFSITIASSLINIVAHYRYYFSLNGWYPNIYLLGDKDDINKSISDGINITSIVLKYIDNSYFIDTSGLTTGIVIKYFLKKTADNLILSRDDFDIMHLSENTLIIKANKDKSKLFSYDNWQDMFTKSVKDEYYNISYKLINMILCFSGAHGRSGVKNIGIRTMLKKVSKALENKMILNDYYSNIHDFISDMKDLLDKYNVSKAISNFNMYDINSNYDKCITKAIEKRLDNYIEDKFSKKDLINLNVKYFTGFNSLMLDELMTKPKSKTDMKW